MGEDKDLYATDSFGRVHGTENLPPADNGPIPKTSAMNPQAHVLSLTRWNVLHIVEKFS
jgi:hypothetical protein